MASNYEYSRSKRLTGTTMGANYCRRLRVGDRVDKNEKQPTTAVRKRFRVLMCVESELVA